MSVETETLCERYDMSQAVGMMVVELGVSLMKELLLTIWVGQFQGFGRIRTGYMYLLE